MSQSHPKVDFQWVNTDYTKRVVADIEALDKGGAVLVEAPPGAGKSSLTVSVSKALADADSKLRLPIVTQTNEQADDLVAALLKRHPDLRVTRLVGGAGGSSAMQNLAAANPDLVISSKHDDPTVKGTQVVVATARKWEFVRSGQQRNGLIQGYDLALIDEAYQMRSDALLGVATMFDRLMCVGDPGQLDPFTTIDDALWKGLEYAPSRTAMGTLSAFHPELTPHQLPLSWRLPPSAAGIVSQAFYPYTGFSAGTDAAQRSLTIGAGGGAPEDDALDRAATEGWAYVELPEKLAVRTDAEVATQLAQLVQRLLTRGADVVDELDATGRKLEAKDVAVVAAHNDQVHAVRFALSQLGVDPDSLVVSTANKVQGREYEVVLVWHPLAGRRDATAFHLEAGRMCVMLSRHRQACIVVGRAGADRLLAEFPDSDPIFLDEPEKFPDGWEANSLVLEHLAGFKA
ncbi:ATP-binding protein [Nocardioides sp. zg-536]|uniref:ATP-binding protein n=1 Tax=Nocardioides faecalis TaxID=2803858 RepID=A0A938Y6I2_9ACTN|nr:AAA domain-containing protein [Nocardioides faecalis]MBM9458775.1 ATP-binding protein [Nocardioides faecalis]QVI60193.1 ATP-binding protein [Nocardioides faecalis]